VLDQSLWISGVLNDVFVSGLPALVCLQLYPRWSRSLQYAPVMLIEAKLLRTRPRTRTKPRGRGRGRGQNHEAEAEDKISASRTVWPRGLNITGTRVRRSAALVPLVGASCFPNDFQISVKCPVSLFAVCLRKLCQYPPWTVFFELVLVLNQWLDFIAEWH